MFVSALVMLFAALHVVLGSITAANMEILADGGEQTSGPGHSSAANATTDATSPVATVEPVNRSVGRLLHEVGGSSAYDGISGASGA